MHAQESFSDTKELERWEKKTAGLKFCEVPFAEAKESGLSNRESRHPLTGRQDGRKEAESGYLRADVVRILFEGW